MGGADEAALKFSDGITPIDLGSLRAGSTVVTPPDQPNHPRRASSESPSCPRYETATLFGAAREIELIHRGEIYRLRITRQEKLILTK